MTVDELIQNLEALRDSGGLGGSEVVIPVVGEGDRDATGILSAAPTSDGPVVLITGASLERYRSPSQRRRDRARADELRRSASRGASRRKDDDRE